MIGFETSGSFDRTIKFLSKGATVNIYGRLAAQGQRGVNALASATPKDHGETAAGWKYRIVKDRDRARIEWYNTHSVDGVNIAVIIQYGHGTGTGGWVEGRDYINPTMRPIFDDMVEAVWKEVKQ